jgi:Ca2+-binding EF-hand superfamily protein
LGVELNSSDLEEIMADLDENKDGKISLLEFKAWWKAGR